MTRNWRILLLGAAVIVIGVMGLGSTLGDLAHLHRRVGSMFWTEVLASVLVDGATVWSGFALPSRRPSRRLWTSITLGAAVALRLLGVFKTFRTSHFTGESPLPELSRVILAVTVLGVALAFQLRRQLATPDARPFDPTALRRPHPVIPPKITDGPNWREDLLASLHETGVQETRRPARWPIYLGLIAILSVGAVVPRILEPLIAGAPGAIQVDIWTIYSLVVLVVIGIPGAHLRRLSQQVRAHRAEQQLKATHAKRPIFYLRSFALDEVIGRPSVLEVVSNLQPPNPEQRLTQVLNKSGPVIAIGRPGEAMPALGAARFYVSNDLWQEKVADVATVAQLVVWASGTTLGLQWEITHLIASLPPEKLVLWAHPYLLDLDPDEREAEWARFVDGLGGLFPKPLPKPLGANRFFVFDSRFEPLGFSGRALSDGDAQTKALRRLLEYRDVPPYDKVAMGRRRLFWRIVRGVALGVVALIAALFLFEFWARVHTTPPAPVGWNLLAEELIGDELDSDTSWNADTSSEVSTPRTPDGVKAKFQDTADSLNGHWFGKNWNDQLPGSLPELKAATRAYAAVYAQAAASPALLAAFNGQGQPLAVNLGPGGDSSAAVSQLDQLQSALASAQTPWTATLPASKGWYFADRLRTLIAARLQMLASEEAVVKFFAAHPGWSLSTGADGAPQIASQDPDFLAQAPGLLGQRTQAAANLRQAEADAQKE